MTVSSLKQQFGPFQFYAACGLVLLVVASVAFTLGRNIGQQQQLHMQQLIQSSENLHQENTRLTAKINVMRLELELAKTAQAKSVAKLQNSLDREVSLRKDLVFYQQVMAPELNPAGLAIDGFAIEKTLSGGYYRFKLTLVQQQKVKTILTGKVEIILHGSLNGQPVSHSLNTLMDQQAGLFTYAFKYFQMIEGEFQLPENFQPEKITIHTSIFKYKRKLGELDKTFDWILSASE